MTSGGTSNIAYKGAIFQRSHILPEATTSLKVNALSLQTDPKKTGQLN